MSHRFDLASLAAGIAVIVVGVLLLVDQDGGFALSFGVVGALLAAVIGVVLLVSGLTDTEPSQPPPTGPPGADER
ncbi:MAG: hypothetical protein GEU88_01345 [Solirubrobacterales bacterium]|nr:hypothetical protein [Solirubrobacterales bacterium]